MSELKSLYEKLKEEFSNRLNGEVKEKYPTKYAEFKGMLESSYYVVDLRFGTACDFCHYMETGERFGITEFYNLFEDEK